MTHEYRGMRPDIDKATFVAESAELAGDIRVGENASLWYHVSMRGDLARIEVGEESNIQDNAVVHVSPDVPTLIGSRVTVGHSAIIHACTIKDGCLIGMGATVLDGSTIGEESIVGAGALVTQNKEFPPRSLIIGSPAKAVRSLSEEEVKAVRENCDEYVELARRYAESRR